MNITHLLWRDLRAEGYGHGSEGGGGGWPGLRQVALVRIVREYLDEPGEPVEAEDHFYLTSLPPRSHLGSPSELLRLVRGHWGIENHLHHVKDRSMAEDASRTAPGALAYCWLRSLAVALWQHVEGDSTPQKALRLAADTSKAVRLLDIRDFRRLRRKV